jgi:hypothetical protein
LVRTDDRLRTTDSGPGLASLTATIGEISHARGGSILGQGPRVLFLKGPGGAVLADLVGGYGCTARQNRQGLERFAGRLLVDGMGSVQRRACDDLGGRTWW